MKKIAIIGAGPAGIYAGLLLKNFNGNITLFEQNKEIGRKLKTTGGGRMNVTNKIFSAKEFSSEEKNLLKKIFKNPHIKNREEIFKKFQTEYEWEDNRAILKSKNAILEVQRLNKLIDQQSNIQKYINSKVESITPQKDKFIIKFKKTLTNEIQEEVFDIVILTQGGMYRIGDLGEKEKIFHIPLSLGHSITNLSPSLGALKFKNKKLAQLSGVSLKVELKDLENKVSIIDDVILTHFGISGPASLDFSALRKSENIEINFLPEISETEFQEKFNKLRQGKNSLKKFLQPYLPKRVIDFHLENADILKSENNKSSIIPPCQRGQGGLFIADISKEKLKNLKKSLFHFKITNIEQNFYSSTWTTKGGISLKEIKNNSFESKIIENLFFAGEILDINGLCGGYNISFAAISAQIVADEILKK